MLDDILDGLAFPAPPMRSLTLTLVLAAALVASSAHAQRLTDLPGEPAPVALSDAPGPLSLSGLFNAQTLRIGHSYEFSYSGFGGQSLGLGVYTTSLQWQPSDRLAARVDVGVAHSPFGSEGVQESLGFSQDAPARVFLRNAELAYRPTDNSVLHLSIRQSPYGVYAAPYGYYNGYPTYGTGLHARYGSDRDLFWRNGQ